METMFGVLFGYMLRGTTGSEGFREFVDSARAVTGTPEFRSMVDAAKAHAATVIRDVTEQLSNNAGHLADALVAGQPAGAQVEPAEWEAWPPAPRKHDRPFSDEIPWPDR